MLGYLFIVGWFSMLAAFSAFLIVYSETRHHFPCGKRPLYSALVTAVFTLITFFILGTIGAVLLRRVL